MENDIYDIAVIGLGVAGAVFAASLGKDFKIIALDKKTDRSDSFRKPCGGLLAPDAQKALAQLGLNLSKDILVDPQIFSVRTVDLDSGLTRNYQRMYLNLDRHGFDMWLGSLLPPTAEKRAGAVVTAVSRENGLYRISFTENGEPRFATAKMLVGADGAASQVRRFLYPGAKLRSYTAIQQWFPDTNPEPFYSCVFDSRRTDCYSWSVSKDGSFIFGGAYPKSGAKAAFEEQKKLLSQKGFRFGEPLKTEACLVLRPRGLRSFRCGKDNAFLIGEAAGFISPSSLEGISSAVISAATLARVLNSRRKNPERAYRRATLSLRLKLAAKVLKCPFMYNRFLRKIVMKTGVKSVSVAPVK